MKHCILLFKKTQRFIEEKLFKSLGSRERGGPYIGKRVFTENLETLQKTIITLAYGQLLK